MYDYFLRFWRVFHSVSEQVDEHLPKTVFISQYTSMSSSLYGYLMGRRGRLHVFYRFQNKRIQFKWLNIKGKLAGLHLGSIQQVTDELGEPVELGIHASEIMQPLLISLLLQAALQNLRKALQTGHRSFEFMARHTDELVFALFFLVGFGHVAKNRDGEFHSPSGIDKRPGFHQRPLPGLRHFIVILNDRLGSFFPAQRAFARQFFIG